MRVHRSTFAALVIFLWSVTSAWAQSAHTWQFSGANIYLDSGAVSIGTSTFPDSTKLSVKGKAIMRELDLKISSQWDPWPDYVFEEGYELLSLDELETAVQRHNRLPGLPSAEEIDHSGIQVGQLNGLLLEKIEELTLYVILQEKEILRLESLIEQQEQKRPTLSGPSED